MAASNNALQPMGPSLFMLFAILVLSYILVVGFYRLFLSPIASIPGPKLAALTGWYEFYYDCWLGGKYVFRIDEMHEKYGSIVRISPREVHINDHEYYDRMYSVSSRLDKDWYFYRFVGTPEAGFGTSSAKLHQARRKAMSKFFSQSAITNLESSVQLCVQKLCNRLEEYRNKTEKPVNLSNAFRNLTVDVISEYALPEGSNLLESRDYTAPFDQQSRSFSYIATWHRHLPFIIPILMAIPRWVVEKIGTEDGLRTFDFQARLHTQAVAVYNTAISGKSADSHSTVLAGIMASDLPPSDKTISRLHQEATTLIGAGSETTANTLETIFYHVLANPSILDRLIPELSSAGTSGTGPIPLDTLKRLPYLTAVVTEGLRIACGVSGRLPRIDPLNTLTYKTHAFPPGTVVSMTIRDAHFDPSVFPDPHAFKPERWLSSSRLDSRSSEERKKRDAYFMPFSRGSRACIGKDLAMTELYLALAALLSRFRFELYETSAWDVSMQCDFFAPFGPVGSKGVRVYVR